MNSSTACNRCRASRFVVSKRNPSLILKLPVAVLLLPLPRSGDLLQRAPVDLVLPKLPQHVDHAQVVQVLGLRQQLRFNQCRRSVVTPSDRVGRQARRFGWQQVTGPLLEECRAELALDVAGGSRQNLPPAQVVLLDQLNPRGRVKQPRRPERSPINRVVSDFRNLRYELRQPKDARGTFP